MIPEKATYLWLPKSIDGTGYDQESHKNYLSLSEENSNHEENKNTGLTVYLNHLFQGSGHKTKVYLAEQWFKPLIGSNNAEVQTSTIADWQANILEILKNCQKSGDALFVHTHTFNTVVFLEALSDFMSNVIVDTPLTFKIFLHTVRPYALGSDGNNINLVEFEHHQLDQLIATQPKESKWADKDIFKIGRYQETLKNIYNIFTADWFSPNYTPVYDRCIEETLRSHTLVTVNASTTGYMLYNFVQFHWITQIHTDSLFVTPKTNKCCDDPSHCH